MNPWNALMIIVALMKDYRYAEAWEFIQRNRKD
jgi:hypothetical protein